MGLFTRLRLAWFQIMRSILHLWVKAKVLPCDDATWQESGLPARSLARAGCRTLLYSANSGSMRADVPPGSFLAFTDHINFSGFNPLSTERFGHGAGYGLGKASPTRGSRWARATRYERISIPWHG